MPAMPFGDMTANFDFARRERIEAEKDRIRSEMSEMEELVTGWEQEAESTKDDIPMVVATRAMEYERNRLLNELEPLHGEVAEALVYLSSPTNSWYRDMSERVRAWITDRRDNPARIRDRALEIVDTLSGPSSPKPHELAIIRQALKLIRN